MTGAAFGSTVGSQLTWQQRDAVSVSTGEYEYQAGDETVVTTQVTITNPLDRPIEVGDGEIALYDGEAPFHDEEKLTSTSGASIPDVTVPANAERTVTLTMPVVNGAPESVRAAVENESASASGVIRLEMLEKEFSVDV